MLASHPRACASRHVARRTAPRPRAPAASPPDAPPPDAPPPVRARPRYVPGVIDDPLYVRIFDTTLRDGEQSPGAAMTAKEKLDIAKQLAKLGVDVIEAGFPAASPNDAAAVKAIADEVGNSFFEDGYVPVICGLARASRRDIDASWGAVRGAARPRVHTFLATSEIHMKYKLKKTEDEVVAMAVDAVSYARSLGCTDVEFSPEDAGRSDPIFLYRVLNAVVDAGATTINIPDTTGWNLPFEFGGLIAGIAAHVNIAGRAVISTHCQNDLGLSTANSLAGVKAGARQVECTINGIGERAGNASLEEVAMALLLRGALLGGCWHSLVPVHISATSRMVADYTGMAVQPHKAIVGANAFAHESGIHQDGMLKHASTYEIFSPATVGLLRSTGEVGLVLGKLSGRAALKTKLAALGYDSIEPPALDDLFSRFKKLADSRQGGFADEDLHALVADGATATAGGSGPAWALEELQVVCGTMGLPTATVRLRGPGGTSMVTSAVGTGPVDAAYKAIDAITGVKAKLVEYGVAAVTAGIDALATTRVQICAAAAGGGQSGAGGAGRESTEAVATTVPPAGLPRVRTYSGAGTDEDIVCASARAYIAALNKMVAITGAYSPQNGGNNAIPENGGGGNGPHIVSGGAGDGPSVGTVAAAAQAEADAGVGGKKKGKGGGGGVRKKSGGGKAKDTHGGAEGAAAPGAAAEELAPTAVELEAALLSS